MIKLTAYLSFKIINIYRLKVLFEWDLSLCSFGCKGRFIPQKRSPDGFWMHFCMRIFATFQCVFLCVFDVVLMHFPLCFPPQEAPA